MQTKTRWTAWMARLGAGLAALTLTIPALAVPIEWVTVGSPNFAKDYTGHGAVGYEYRISKYETTNAQYVEFLNAVAGKEDQYSLYDTQMTISRYGGIAREGLPGSYAYSTKPGMQNKPVNFVSFFDALRFANWLSNGKGSGDTETGSYALSGGNPESVVRDQGATFFLPTEDEWYKAAFSDPVSGEYFDYPTGSNEVFLCGAPSSSDSHGNCSNRPGGFVDVGSYPWAASPYGTFDQGGNAFEWVDVEGVVSGVIRGGGFIQSGEHFASIAGRWPPPEGASAYSNTSFRLGSTLNVPEPSTGLLLLLGLLGLARSGKRRRG